MPELAVKCIESWKKYCPDYELKLWNEDSFDLNSNRFCKEAYLSKKYAFVTDYVRLYALYNYGGVYMDTDVELIKDIKCFLDCPAFSGFETTTAIPTGIMASEKNGEWIKEQLEYYKSISFVKLNGAYNMKTNVQIITESAEKYNFAPNSTFVK